MRLPRLVLLPGLLLAACGGDDGGGVVPDAAISDGPPAPDAEVPDAEPAPDAMVTADFTCADEAQPTAGTDPIVINGLAQALSFSGATNLANATAEAYRTGDGTAVATDLSDADGLFTLTIDNDALAPVDGYVKGVGPEPVPPSTTRYLDSYVYPPFPLAADTPETPLLFVTNQDLNLLAFVSEASQDAAHGVLGILVIDCAGNPVQGAAVTITPTATAATTEIVYVGDNMVPDPNLAATGALGLAFVFNAPTGDVVVDATAGGNGFDEHTITVRVGTSLPAITQTAIAPGPVTP